MNDNTTAWLAIGISVLSAGFSVATVLLTRATRRRMERNARGEIWGVDY